MVHLHGMIVSSLLPGRTFNFMSEMPKLPSIQLQERRIQGKLCKLMFGLTSFPFKSLLLLRCRARVHAFLVLSTQQALSQCLWRKEESKSVYFQFKIYLLFSRTYNGEGNGTPPQCSCLENPMDGGARQAAVHGVAEGRTRLSDFTFTFHFHALEKERATHSSVLAWRIPGTWKPGGLPSMVSHRVRHD